MKIEISIFLSNQSFLFIIQKMRSQKNRASFSSCVSNLRHKCSNFQNQLPRLSFAYNYKSPLFFVEKQAANLKRFSVIHAQALQNLAFLQKDQIAQLQRPRTRKLKESLNALELKISQANKQLRRWPEALENEQSDEESNTNLAQQLQSGTKEQILSTNYSSIGKISFNQSHTTLNCFQQLKTYYLSHIQQAIQGKNSRALEHLNLSLKILHNRYKIVTPTFSQLDKLKVSLAKNSSDMGKKTLLLDIDQTLLRCQYDNSKAYDIALPIPTEGGGKATAFISFRPYAISFLKRMSKIFEIVAFTAAHQDYADRVLDQIDPKRQYIKHRLYRKNCFEIYQNIYAKDLRIINRELSDMVLVDNSPFSYIYQLDNAIPILPYLGGEDNQLIQLQKYLELVAKCADVRGLNKATFKFHLFYLFRAVEDLARTLYQA